MRVTWFRCRGGRAGGFRRITKDFEQRAHIFGLLMEKVKVSTWEQMANLFMRFGWWMTDSFSIERILIDTIRRRSQAGRGGF